MTRGGTPWLLILLIAAACDSSTGEPLEAPTSSTIPTTVATSDASTTTRPELISTIVADDTAPPELEGAWRSDLGGGDRVTLTLRGTTYLISRGGNAGSGVTSVAGDTIVFSGSNLCEGMGTYRWSLDSEALTFTATGAADPCGGRMQVLDGVTYTR